MSLSTHLNSLRLLCAAAGLAVLVAPAYGSAALDASQRDASTAACMDFYQHANGGWLSASPVPVGYGSFGYTDELRAAVGEQQRALLKGFADAPADALDSAIARVYALGLDEAGIESAGLKDAQPFLSRIDAISKPKDLAPTLAELHRWGAPILFGFSAGADLEQPQQVIAYANQGGLGLPDRDYYLREDAPALELRTAYRAYVERLLALSGRAEPGVEADRVLAFETELARVSLSLEQLREPRNSYRPTALRELERRHPNLRWKDYLRAQGLRSVKSFSLAHLTFFDAINARMEATPLPEWQAYLRFHVLHAAAPFMGQAFVSAHDSLFVSTLAGQQAPSRERRVLGHLQSFLGDALGQRYARQYMPPMRRESAVGFIESIRAQFRAAVEGASWLEAEGRTALLTDIDALTVAVGGPAATAWGEFELQADSYASAVLALARFRHASDMATVGKAPTPRWPIAPSSLQPSYDASSHTLYVPAGLLQPPLFEPDGDIALNYGGAGAVIARSLMAAFDPASGARRGLLSEASRQAFAARSRGLVAQYGAFVALGPLTVDGAATWSENAADLAGLQTAYTAFLAAGGERADSVDGLTSAQRFFYAWARLLRRNYLDEALRLQLASDTRAPAKFRVNGPLPHLSAFTSAFACAANSPMSLPEPARALIW